MSLLSEDHVFFRLPSMQGMSDQDESDLFIFHGSVGPNGENRREDVIKAQMLLAQTGDYEPVSEMPTGWPSADLYRAITKLQRRAGKQLDGTILPLPPGGVDENGVGETLEAARGEVGRQFAGQKAPTPNQVDAYYEAQSRFRNTVAGKGEMSPSTEPDSPVLSDEPPAKAVWQDGGQSAQVSPTHQQAMQQAVQATQRLLGLPPGPGNPPRDQYGVSEDEKKLGREIGNRVGEKLNLLNLAPHLIGGHARSAGIPASRKQAGNHHVRTGQRAGYQADANAAAPAAERERQGRRPPG